MTWKKGFNIDGGIRDKVDARIRKYHEENRKRGRTRYGSDFKGKPLEQGFEEAFDLLFYIATEIERRDHINKKVIVELVRLGLADEEITEILEMDIREFSFITETIAIEEELAKEELEGS